MLERTGALSLKTTKNSPQFSLEDAKKLDNIDQQLMDIMLSAENLVAHCCTYKQEWSPHQRLIARFFSYWKQKSIMESKKNWSHLYQLHKETTISELDHMTRDPKIILEKKRDARTAWRACKKKSAMLHKQFLSEKADFLTQQLHTTEVKAL